MRARAFDRVYLVRPAMSTSENNPAAFCEAAPFPLPAGRTLIGTLIGAPAYREKQLSIELTSNRPLLAISPPPPLRNVRAPTAILRAPTGLSPGPPPNSRAPTANWKLRPSELQDRARCSP